MKQPVFSPKQRTVLTWWVPGSLHAGKEAIVCDGAVRSGKTLAMGLSFFLWAMSCFDGKKFGVCGKTIASLRRNVLSEILPRLTELGARWQEKRSENLVTVTFRGRENQFYIFGGRDESSASLIQGITFAGVLLDEVVLMPRSFVEQACARCSVAGSRIWFNCNPAGPNLDSGSCQAQLSAAALYHGGQSLPDPADSPAVSAAVHRGVLQAVCTGSVGAGGGTGV